MDDLETMDDLEILNYDAKPTLKERFGDIALGATVLGPFVIPVVVAIICLMNGE